MKKMFFLLPLVFFSCKKDTAFPVNNNDITESVDFRDEFVGSYNCLVMYHHFSPPTDSTTNWLTDTSAVDYVIEIEKYADSSVLVITSPNSSFIGDYVNGKTFTCSTCSGPDNYARFYSTDSIYVYKKYGVLNSYYYYGKKL